MSSLLLSGIAISKYIKSEFELPMLVTDDGQIYTFEGDADLGLLAGGRYVYNGTAHDGQFNAEYSAENNDHGLFTMCKVKTCGAAEDSCGACSSRAECNHDADNAEAE